MTLDTLFQSVFPSLLVSVLMLIINSRQKRRENERDRRQEKLVAARNRESVLHLNLQMATAKLAYANAMAIKRGRPNGEIEEGVSAYETAKKEYLNFLNQQATESLNDNERGF